MQAITKLKQALEQDEGRADACWCLGNAYTSQGFLCNDRPEALQLFDKASDCFKKCSEKVGGEGCLGAAGSVAGGQDRCWGHRVAEKAGCTCCLHGAASSVQPA